MATPKPTAIHIISRVAASLLGGYFFVWGFTTLGITGSVAAGARYDDAERLFYLLAILVYLMCFFMAFLMRRQAGVWALLAGGGALMTATAWLITRMLVQG